MKKFYRFLKRLRYYYRADQPNIELVFLAKHRFIIDKLASRYSTRFSSFHYDFKLDITKQLTGQRTEGFYLIIRPEVVSMLLKCIELDYENNLNTRLMDTYRSDLRELRELIQCQVLAEFENRFMIEEAEPAEA